MVGGLLQSMACAARARRDKEGTKPEREEPGQTEGTGSARQSVVAKRKARSEATQRADGGGCSDAKAGAIERAPLHGGPEQEAALAFGRVRGPQDRNIGETAFWRAVTGTRDRLEATRDGGRE